MYFASLGMMLGSKPSGAEKTMGWDPLWFCLKARRLNNWSGHAWMRSYCFQEAVEAIGSGG